VSVLGVSFVAYTLAGLIVYYLYQHPGIDIAAARYYSTPTSVVSSCGGFWVMGYGSWL